MNDPVTKEIHCRLTHEGTLNCVTSDQIDGGITLDDDHDGEAPYRDFVIEIKVRPPEVLLPVAASIDVPDEVPPEVTATAAATAA
ncbi:MAG: hypothetical protein AB7K67_01095 [Hyphomicrobiaceae bacterium]